MDVLAQANAINVPPHQVSLVAEKPISPAPQPFPAFVLNGNPTNTMAKVTDHIQKRYTISLMTIHATSKTQRRNETHRCRPLAWTGHQAFQQYPRYLQEHFGDAKNHLCETDYRQLLVLLGEVWKATKRQGSDMNDCRREKLLYDDKNKTTAARGAFAPGDQDPGQRKSGDGLGSRGLVKFSTYQIYHVLNILVRIKLKSIIS